MHLVQATLQWEDVLNSLLGLDGWGPLHSMSGECHTISTNFMFF
jgi:hypothetical protein